MVLTLLLNQTRQFPRRSYGEPYPTAPDFELLDANGKPFRLSDQSGKIVLLFFGYTAVLMFVPQPG